MYKRQALESVERTGYRLFNKYKHASTLISEYYKVAFDIALYTEQSEVEEWSAAAKIFLADRAKLTQFLSRSLSSRTIPWSFVSRLASVKSHAAITYLEYYSALEKIYAQDFLDSLQETLVTFSSGPHPMGSFYRALIDQKSPNIIFIPPLLTPLTDCLLYTSDAADE